MPPWFANGGKYPDQNNPITFHPSLSELAEFQLNKAWEVISLYKDDYMTLENVKGYYCLAVVQ